MIIIWSQDSRWGATGFRRRLDIFHSSAANQPRVAICRDPKWDKSNRLFWGRSLSDHPARSKASVANDTAMRLSPRDRDGGLWKRVKSSSNESTRLPRGVRGRPVSGTSRTAIVRRVNWLRGARRRRSNRVAA